MAKILILSIINDKTKEIVVLSYIFEVFVSITVFYDYFLSTQNINIQIASTLVTVLEFSRGKTGMTTC